MQIDIDFKKQVEALLEEAHQVVVTNHLNPDGDAVGSALALAALLHACGKEVQVIMPNDYPHNLKWISGSEQVVFYDSQKMQSDTLIQNCDLIFHLDYNSLKRSGPMQQALENASARKVVIDHHQQPEDFADAIYSDVEMSSTCEMVYRFAVAMGWQALINTSVAEALYTGIATDTGNFRFNSTRPTTHRAVAFLLEQGLQPGQIASQVYDSNKLQRLKLLSVALNKMEVLPDYRTAIITLTENDLAKYQYEKGDTEGFVNYGLSVAGVEISVFVYQREGKVKMSFRSKTNFDVNTLARTHFDGGGHLNAAGALSDRNLPDTIKKLKEVLNQYEESLQNYPHVKA